MKRRDEYRQYLKSPEWKEHRDLALVRTDGFCQFCGGIAADVHHVRYPKQLGAEHPHSLVPVCEQCHAISHGIHDMKKNALENVKVMHELTPDGAPMNYLLTDGRVYASAKSWMKALHVPDSMRVWFESGLSRVSMLRKSTASGDFEMTYRDTLVYRWHAVDEQLRAFDRAWHTNQFKALPDEGRRERAKFHENYEKLVRWGQDLQERALRNAIESRTMPATGVTQANLVEAIKQAVAPRLRQHDDKLDEHDIVIGEIKKAVPTLRPQDEFVTVRQAISEKGFDPIAMPLHPDSRETLPGLAGQLLKQRGAEQGASVISRLDGRSVDVEVNTYRRGDIYIVLDEIARKKQEGLKL